VSLTGRLIYVQNNLHVTLTPFRGESRVLKETASLVQQGLVQRVFIVALFENGLREREDIDAVRTVWRVKLRSRNWPKNFISQLFKYVEFCWRVSSYANRNQVKMVNIHWLGLLPLGVWLKLRFGAKLIYDTHELETETMGLNGFRKAVSKVVERALIRFADLTIVVGKEIEKWYRKEYQINSIATVLNCPPYRQTQKTRLLRDEFNIPDSQKVVLYQGALSTGRGVELLLDAFENASDNRYVVIFMGYGELEKRIKDAVARCPRIRYKPGVPPSEVLAYTASADVGISAIEDSCLSYHYCLPNKMFEYVMAHVPVVVSNLPEMRNVVNTYGVGAVMQNWDDGSIFQALRRLEELNKDVLDRNLNVAAKEFSWQGQEEVMAQAYKTHILAKGD